MYGIKSCQKVQLPEKEIDRLVIINLHVASSVLKQNIRTLPQHHGNQQTMLENQQSPTWDRWRLEKKLHIRRWLFGALILPLLLNIDRFLLLNSDQAHLKLGTDVGWNQQEISSSWSWSRFNAIGESYQIFIVFIFSSPYSLRSEARKSGYRILSFFWADL